MSAFLASTESIPPAGAEEIRLTQQVKAGGCASKLLPGMLEKVLSRVPQQTSDDLLVGLATQDDAGVYRIGPDLALVQTVDFFTPMVDAAEIVEELRASGYPAAKIGSVLEG